MTTIENDIWIQGNNYFKINSVLTRPELELIITPECNQSCDYCYIHNFGEQLYPKEYRADKKITLKNLTALLDYYIYKKKFFFVDYELFAGDIFFNNYFFEIMDILYPYFTFMYQKAPELFQKFHPMIIVPSNLRFVENNEIVNKIYNVINQFQQIQTKLVFSWSTDGKFAINHREKLELSSDYWEKCFKFIQHTDSSVHVMLAPENIDTAIQNYKWWKECINKYLPERLQNNYTPYYLEVRNNNWTDETINKYLEFLQYIFYDYYEQCGFDATKFIYSLFKGDGANSTLKKLDQNLLNIFNCITTLNNTDTSSCSLQNMDAIRLSDLALVPCHRTSYNLFVCGKYLTNENNEIIKFEPHNLDQYINLKNYKTNFLPECCLCWNNKYCMKGCIGSQFETFGELYLPIPIVCKLLKAKTSYILQLFKEINAFEIIENASYIDEQIKCNLHQLRKELGYG